MKTCKACKGRGYTMTGLIYVDDGYYLKAKNTKKMCTRCYGKGVK